MEGLLSGLALFCQDARDEVGGTVTLVGLLSDNITVEKSPQPGVMPAIPKLVVYNRINLDANSEPERVEFLLRTPSGAEVANNVMNAGIIEQAKREAARDKNPFAGLIARVEANPFPLEKGRYFAVVRIDGAETILGTLNVQYGSA